MPRRKTLPDSDVLDAAHGVMHAEGPEALTFARLATATGLSASTLVQRFGSKEMLKQRALLQAWDRLDARTTAAAAAAERTPRGAIRLLVSLSGYGDIEAYAEGLLVLREDLRDPVLRARGAAWKSALARALDACFSGEKRAPPGIGMLMATQWQGSLLWWSFDPKGRVERHVGRSLEAFVAALLGPASRRRA
jgi:AcrR family transcriptional regulator